MSVAGLEQLLPDIRNFDSVVSTDQLCALPNVAAVYLLVDVAGTPILLASTQQLRRIALSRLSAPAEDAISKRADLAQITRGIRWREVHSRFEADWWFYRAARGLHPQDYRKRISFGPAWFLHVDWAARVPEIRVSERIWRLPGEFIGPFPSRQATQQALEGLWDLFDLCRYPEQVRQAPRGQRCAYAEMGRCDAPCDGSAPMEPIVARTRAAWTFAGGEMAPWIAAAQERMRAAAAELRFELAAQVKRQLEFAGRWQRLWRPLVRREFDLRCLLLAPVVRRRAHKPFLFERGTLIGGPVCRARGAAGAAAAWAIAAMTAFTPEEDDRVRMEQTWLLAHFLNQTQARSAVVLWLRTDVSQRLLEAELQAALAARDGARKAGEIGGEDIEMANDESAPNGENALR